MAENSMAHLAHKHQLRLSGGGMTFNTPEEREALERFIGTDQVVDLTVQGVVAGVGLNNGTYTITFLVSDFIADVDDLTRAADDLERRVTAEV